jgi:hypothetical protein
MASPFLLRNLSYCSSEFHRRPPGDFEEALWLTTPMTFALSSRVILFRSTELQDCIGFTLIKHEYADFRDRRNQALTS